jgi:hypothetical protein
MQMNNPGNYDEMQQFILMAESNQSHTAMGNYGMNQNTEPKNY